MANLTAQSDQFALGLVLYELAAGTRAFQRQSAAETMAAIIRDEADPLPPPTPAPLRWIIERLLAKDAGNGTTRRATSIGNSGRSATGSLMPQVHRTSRQTRRHGSATCGPE